MEIRFHPSAVKELQESGPETQKFLKERIGELRDAPLKTDGVRPIEVEGRGLFRYRMRKGPRGGKKDHRAVFDIRGDEVVVFAVFHRDEGYRKKEISDRL